MNHRRLAPIRWLPLLLSFFILVGCALQTSPLELLRAPSMPEDWEGIRNAVAHWLPKDARLTVSKKGENRNTAILRKDLTGDGVPEVIALYRKGADAFEYGFLILQRESEQSEWKLVHLERTSGRDVDFILFRDVTGDGIPDIVTGWGSGLRDRNELRVTTIKPDSGYYTLNPQTYSAAAIDDLDGDGAAELVLLTRNGDRMEAYAALLQYRGNQLQLIQTIRMYGGINGFDRAIAGAVGNGQKGVFVHAGVGASSAYSWLFTMENGKLVDRLNVDPTKPSWFNPRAGWGGDLNEDGLLEVSRLVEPPGTKGVPYAAMPWLHELYQLKDGHKPALVIRAYIDVQFGYWFDYPVTWDEFATLRRWNDEGGGGLTIQTLEGKELLKLVAYPVQRSAAMEARWTEQGIAWHKLAELSGAVLYLLPAPHLSQSDRNKLPGIEDWIRNIRPFHRDSGL